MGSEPPGFLDAVHPFLWTDLMSVSGQSLQIVARRKSSNVRFAPKATGRHKKYDPSLWVTCGHLAKAPPLFSFH